MNDPPLLDAPADAPRLHVWAGRLLLLVLLMRLLGGSAWRSAVDPKGYFGMDFQVFYTMASHLREGVSVYAQQEHFCSPLVVLLVRPLTVLPPDTAFRIWSAVNVAAVLAGGMALGAALGSPGLDTGLMALGMIMAMRNWPMQGFALGIGNTEPLDFLVLALLFWCTRHQRWRGFSVVTAVGGLLKAWMLFPLLYLALQRRWREIGEVAAWVAGANVVMFTILGWGQFTACCRLLLAHASQAPVQLGLPGVSLVMLVPGLGTVPVVAAPAARPVVLGLGYAALAAGVWFMGKRGPRRGPAAQALLAWVVQTTLLALPVCHMGYYVLALPAVMVLMRPPAPARLVVAGILLYGCLSIPTPTAAVSPGQTVLATSAFFCGVALWGALLVLLRQKETTT